MSPPQAAALAEELGELALAEQYAERFLARGAPDSAPALAHALLARGAARRGDRPTAVKLWQAAAAILMDSRFHLNALQLGWQCGGEEGRAVAEAACAAMGRPMKAVLQELQAVGATFQDGGSDRGAAVAWAVAWAAGESGGAAKAGGSKGDNEAKASTPRRKLEDAKKLDGACGGRVWCGCCMCRVASVTGGGTSLRGVSAQRERASHDPSLLRPNPHYRRFSHAPTRMRGQQCTRPELPQQHAREDKPALRSCQDGTGLDGAEPPMDGRRLSTSECKHAK